MSKTPYYWEENTKLYPPLTSYYNRLKALLENDPQVKVALDYDDSLITVTVSNQQKANAWRKILPVVKQIGSVSFKIEVICNIDEENEITVDDIKTAFTGNKMFSRVRQVLIPEIGIDREFCYFRPDVIQFDNDNFGSPESLETWTVESLVREVLSLPPVSVCSEPIENMY